MNKSPTSYSALSALALCMALQMTGFVLVLPLFARRFESFGAGVYALADRFGRRPIILFSLATSILAYGGYLFATTVWMLIALRGLAGLFNAGLAPAILGSVGDLAPQDRRARWIGIVNGGASAGWIIGPQNIFLMAAGLVFALVVAAGLGLPVPQSPETP